MTHDRQKIYCKARLRYNPAKAHLREEFWVWRFVDGHEERLYRGKGNNLGDSMMYHACMLKVVPDAGNDARIVKAIMRSD